MTTDEKFAIATQLYVRLRRAGGRIIDVIWAMGNEEYAREVLRVARSVPDSQLEKLADRFEELAFGVGKTRAQTPDPTDPSDADGGKYLDTLR